MALTTRSLIAGLHLYWFRDGVAFTVPSAGTAGREALPGAADDAWIDLGIVREGSIQHDREEHEIYAPLPGRKRLWEVLETKGKITISGTLEEVSPLAVELAFGADALDDDSTSFTPLDAPAKKGWLRLQVNDELDAALTTVTVYARLKLAGPVQLGDQPVSIQIEGVVLHSSLNAGTL